MSLMEIVVIVSGLFLGYWVVSKFLFTPEKPSTEPDPVSWHTVLNISPHATTEEIRQTYKSLMSQYHPDKVATLGDDLKKLAEHKSKEITRAYREALRAHGANL